MNNLAIKLQQHLFIFLGFFIPISIAITNFIISLLVLCWIFEGNLKIKVNIIKSSKWLIALFALIVLYVLGMFWGDNHIDSSWQFQRLALLIMFPILATITIHQKTIKQGAIAFLLSTFLSAILAILINNDVIKPLGSYISFIENSWKISAFIKYNYHNVLLALSSTVCIYLLIEKKTKNNALLIIGILIYAISIFTERGRAGQVIFNFSAIFYIIYYGRKHIFRGFCFLFLLFCFQALIYNTTNVYKQRLDNLSRVIKNNGDIQKSNTKDIRYVFFIESFKRIVNHPVLGHGTGSFATIFNNEVVSGHDFSDHKTPHNQYIYVWFEIGIFGLVFLLLLFFFQIIELFKKRDGIHRCILPLTFGFLMFVDSYLFIFILTIAYIYLYTIYSRYELE